jgi:homoserine kinase type II
MPRDLICLSCPNGCHLTIDDRGDQHGELQGNRCERGLDFARSLLDGGMGVVTAREPSAARSDEKIQEIAAFWGISVKAVHPRLIPAGSPERTLFRTVIEEVRGARFVLEEIPASARYAKMRIIRSLEFLSGKGLAGITPYRADAAGNYLYVCDGGLWQLVPFVDDVPLDRRRYLHEVRRARLLSRFLIELKETSGGLPYFSLDERFSITTYIFVLVSRIEKHAPALMPRVGRALAFLEKEFLGVHDALPVGFCHGDYHPLNIIWGESDIRSVIDWEFSGIKPEIYDLANMVGCLGMEHPSSLLGELVVNLITQVKTAGIFADISWGYFFEFVVALRFAWLSEWLRKDDQEMIGLELDYLELLIQNRDLLAREWAV